MDHLTLFPEDREPDEPNGPPDRPTPEELTRLRDRLPPEVLFGTSSWNYPGWAGLVYSRLYPAAGKTAEMLAEYARFPLFRTVGIDSSFYDPPTPETLDRYADALPPGFRCVSKVWDRITVHTFASPKEKRRSGEQNPDFLSPALFIDSMYGPYQERFRDHTGPFVFEFQTISEHDGFTRAEFADRLDRFFSALPPEGPYAVEIRNPEYLTPAYFAVLREHNVAHVFNSWTRMPSIGTQLDLPEPVTASFLVVRALLSPGRTYSDAVDSFAPYDRIKEADPSLRADLIRLIETARRLRLPLYLLVNNRTEGSAPLTITALARMLTEGGKAAGRQGGQ